MVNPNLKTGCPYCNMSKGEKEIKKILERWDIKYIPQKTFDDCKDIFCLKFDFYLPNSNTCIEYQGKQHYYDLGIPSREKDIRKTWEHDNIKKEYCKNKNIHYIEIPYWTFEDLEYYLFDKLVEVNEIENLSA